MDDTRFDRGRAIRTAVMGDERVRTSLMDADDFSRPLQEMMTAFAWGEVWGGARAIDRRTQSATTIAMLIALNRGAELKAHVLAGMNNGLSACEIREIIMHSAVYCGFPAALEATRIAADVISRNARA